ncbi:PDF receptor-like isoform X2 [Glandiceps talaboti]
MATTKEACLDQLAPNNLTTNGSFCPAYWMVSDIVMLCVEMCWPPTLANSSASILCPTTKWWKAGKNLEMYCQPNGQWTNISAEKLALRCIDDYTGYLIREEFGVNPTEKQVVIYQRIVENTKILQIIGYSISFASLIIALFIFYSFRSLHCPRTQIHRQLFISYIIWNLLDIIFSIDLAKDVKDFNQACTRSQRTIRNTPILCETSVFLMEYTRFCVFSWNFVEGFYLHRLITAAVFRKPNFKLYYVIGWVVALIPVTAWAIVTHYTSEQQAECWLGYVFSPYYWIIEGPRNALLFVNLIFLINIVRVLITKMRESNTADTMQVKKAVKAAMVLVPLLGVVNLLFIPDRPDATADSWVLYLYGYGTSILVTFQGFVCALIFCFFNSEVQRAIKRKWSGWRDSRSLSTRRGTYTHTSEIRMNYLCDNNIDTYQNGSDKPTAV